jgi:serine-type D-Ala-D-Ala carboxypeptidase (penicillin-binding protein 5/6)
MAINSLSSNGVGRRAAPAWQVLLAGMVAVAITLGGAAYAANNSVQGAKKADEGYDADAPTAILIEA